MSFSHPITMSRQPDAVVYEGDLFDAGWERKGVDAYGRQPTFRIFSRVDATQATFNILTDGMNDRGLRITLERSLFVGETGNGVEVDISVNAMLAAPTAAYADGTLTIVYSADPQAFAAVKAVIDAINGITSAYFGGEAGAGNAVTDGGEFAGGTVDAANRNAGLLVTLGRATGRLAGGGNGYAVTVAAAAATAVTVDDGDRTIEIDVAAADDLSDVKTAVDADAALTSAYFGGENGASFGWLENTESANGTDDDYAWVEVTTSSANPGLLKFGTEVPDNADDGTSMVVTRTTRGRLLLPGQSVYTKRGRANDMAGSVELWRIPKVVYDATANL